MASVGRQYHENIEDAREFQIIGPDGCLIKSPDMQANPAQRDKPYRYPTLEEVRSHLDFATLEQVRKLVVFVGGIQHVLFDIEPPLSLRALCDRLNPHLGRITQNSQSGHHRLCLGGESVFERAQYLYHIIYFPQKFAENGHAGITRLDGYSLWFKDGRENQDERICRNQNAHQQLAWMQRHGYIGISPESKAWEIIRVVKRGRLLQADAQEWLLAAYHPGYTYDELAEEIPVDYPVHVHEGVMICTWNSKNQSFIFDSSNSLSSGSEGRGSRPAVRAFIEA